MFSSALKSFTSNITSNYTISPQPSSTSGPWRIFDAKRKATGKAASVFVFDKNALEAPGGGLGGGRGGGAAGIKRAQEEVVERLRKEAASLARLRHPSILELAEPVEDTRNGGLMFATERVTASLASLLQEKDEQERSGGVGGRGSRYVVEEADGTRRRRELEIDELEIQKGLLQLGKGLEFLHESAGLVHGNLTPEAVLVNAKGDWKLSGLAFCGQHESSTSATSFHPISLHEVLNHDPRLPRAVQLNIDYTSPDFVLDNTLTASADMFSLGLLIVALYNSPHTSPLSTGGSLSSYKRIFSSSSSVPTSKNNFLVPSSATLPPKLASDLLPRLITRRPAQRLNAREFQEASYFDNILVSTIRFLDALPAKTPNEKAAFLRGLPRIVPQFPASVLEKKVLPALLEEMKDRELLAPILTNIFTMVKAMPTGKRAFTEKVVPRLREVFVLPASSGGPARQAEKERDASKEAGLMVLLENMGVACENCSGKEFREDLLPIILVALESSTHGLVDAALNTLPHVLPMLDFSTIKHDLFPVIATVFTKTSSLHIKIRGLEAFYTLCGGSAAGSEDADDDLNGIGIRDKKGSTSASSAILDKFTVQEKVVPLLKAIKTKEPGVMMAALRVFKQVGQVADSDFLAMDVLPTLWSMSLGPLLDLQQFQAFMALIKSLGSRIEQERTRKLTEVGGHGSMDGARNGGTSRRAGAVPAGSVPGLSNGEEADFETLVSGRKPAANGNGDLMNDWDPSTISARPTNVTRTQSSSHVNSTPTFSWQTPVPTSHTSQASTMGSLRAQQLGNTTMRTITPDQTLSSFAPLTPASAFSQPLQPSRPGNNAGTMNASSMPLRPSAPASGYITPSSSNAATSINWTAASQQSYGAQTRPTTTGGFGLSPPPSATPQDIGQYSNTSMQPGQQPKPPPQSSGLDRYESLL